jgi:hypothetical protein
MRLHFSIAILLTTAIAAPQLRTPNLLSSSSNPLLELSHLSVPVLRRPPELEQLPMEDTVHDSNVSVHTYGELERFAKYASAVYQFLCPRPLGNTLVQSVSARLICYLFVIFLLFSFATSSLMYLRTRMDSLRVMIGDARLLLRFGGAMSLRIWSLVRAFSLGLLRVLLYARSRVILYVSLQMATWCLSRSYRGASRRTTRQWCMLASSYRTTLCAPSWCTSCVISYSLSQTMRS